MRTAEWLHLLAHGKLPGANPDKIPTDFMVGDDWRERLTRCVKGAGAESWYAWYQLGVLLLHGALQQRIRRLAHNRKRHSP